MSERPLIAKLLEVEEYKAKYHEYLKLLSQNYDLNGLLNDEIDAVQSLIGGFVEQDTTSFTTVDAQIEAVSALRIVSELRALSIVGQVEGTIPSTYEAQALEPDKLVDASGLDWSKLSSRGAGPR
jgi:hypothetical protein